MTTRLRRTLGNVCLVAALTVPALLCIAAWIAFSVVQRPQYVVLYIAPFALSFFLWLRCRLLTSWAAIDVRLALDGVVVVLSALRLTGPIVPTSGHMLFFVFTLLTTSSVGYRLLAVALIAETSYLKLVVWQDRASWAYGTLAGLVLGAVCLALNLVHRARVDCTPTAGSPTT